MNEIKELLRNVSAIAESDRKIQEERRARGEKFNIFSILELYSQEVQMHSRVIAGLLDAKGDHGLKDAFLKAFIEITGIGDLEFDAGDCNKNVEFYIGPVTDTGGGQIDILLTSGRKAIIIENKVFAGDQDKQLLRYHNHAKKHYDDFRLLYLTLDGKKPSPKSLGEGGQVEYICISYKDHIAKWLDRCIEIAVRLPLVRETLIQYTGIVNKLTNQNMETKEELVKMITGDERMLESANIIIDNWDACRKAIVVVLAKTIEKIAKELDLSTKIDDNFGNGTTRADLFNSDWNLVIRYYFPSTDYKLLLGLDHGDNGRCPETVVDKLRAKCDKLNELEYNSWIVVSWFTEWNEARWSTWAGKEGEEKLYRLVLAKTKAFLDALEPDIGKADKK